MRSCRLASALAVVLLCLLAPALSAQGTCLAVVNAPTADPVSGNCNVIPFGQSVTYSAGYTYLSRIPASLMDINNPYVEDISFSPCGTGTWASNTVVIAMGHLPSPAPATFNFPTFDAGGTVQTIGDFLDLTVAHNSFGTGTPGPTSTTGPFSWNQTTDTWSPMGFAASVGTGFLWNGIDDVGFFITFLNSTVTGSIGSMHTDTLQRTYGPGFNRATSATNNSTAALKMRLAVSQGPNQSSVPVWQCNNASAGLTVNGAPDAGPVEPIRSGVSTGVSASADFSGLLGSPWDVAITIPETGLAVGAGGFLTAGNQAVNINLGAPSLQFLFNAALTNSFAPFSNLVTSNVPLTLAAQSVVVDPASPDGFSLSALNELTWDFCDANQNFETLPLGDFVGASVPTVWVSPSNGAAPWTVDASGTPSTATGPTSAFGGSNYLYCETSGQTNLTYSFDTCAIASTQLTSFSLNFALSRIGASVGTLNIYIDDGSGAFATLLTSYVGADPSQSQNGLEWSMESISFTSSLQAVAFRFEYIAGATFTGDLAIDDLTIQ